MRKLFLLITFQLFLVAGLLAQSGTSWYNTDFSALNGQDLSNYADGRALWDTTQSTTTTSNFIIDPGTLNGDYFTSNSIYFNIAADTDTENLQNEIIEAHVDLPKESEVAGVPNNFYFVFDWWSDQANLGGGTDPDLDPDATISIELRIHDGSTWGSWQEVWTEDDQALLESTTTIAGNPFNWDDYNNDIEGWYQTEIDFSSMVNDDDSVAVRITYNGINAGNFALDNFDIRYETLDDWEQVVYLDNNYKRVPPVLAENMTFDFNAVITKNNTSVFDDSENDEIKLYVNSDYKAYADMQEADFTDGDTESYSFSNYVGDFPEEGVFVYDIFINNAISGTNSDLISLILDQNLYQRDNNTADDVISADLSSPGVGVLYHFPVAEHWDGLNLAFSTTGVDYNYQLIKVSGPDATSGEVIYTSDNLTTGLSVISDFNSDEQILLEAGYYIVLINQLTSTDIELNQDDQDYGFYYRGTANNLTKVENTGFPFIRMRIQPNRAPNFESGLESNFDISTGQQFSYTFEAEDADMDVIGFNREDPAQAWLQADWLTVTAVDDTTFTLSGTPNSAGDYTVDITIGDAEGDSTTNTFNFTVLAPYEVDFVENFNTFGGTDNDGWAILNDVLGNETSNHWDTHELEIYADNEFKGDQYTAQILGENGKAQEDWLISPAIMVPDMQANSDSTAHLEFVWKMDWKYFTGLTLGNDNDGYDIADMTVLISTDGGSNWTQVWKEDDSTAVLSTTYVDDNGTTGNDEYYDDTKLDPAGWPGYIDGSYEYNQNDYYLTRIDLADYAGQNIWVAFKYETTNSSQSFNAAFNLDYMDVKLIEPGIELSAEAINTTGYTLIPITQVQPITVAGKVANLKREDITGGQAVATYTLDGETIFSEATTFDVNGEDTTDISYANTVTPEEHGTLALSIDAEYIDNEGTSYSASDTESFYISSATNGTYAIDNNTPGELLETEDGDFFGMPFEIFNEDNLRKVRLYIGNHTFGDEISFTLIKDGAVVFNTQTYNITGNNWQVFDFEDRKIEPGTYYLMVKVENTSNNLDLYLDNDVEGMYYEGTQTDIAVNEESAANDAYGNLMIRMVLGNDAPQFNPALTNEEGVVGTEFSYNISATDDNGDSLTFMIDQAPDWVSLANMNDGNRAMISGTPGANDVGSNLVHVAVYDVRDTVRSSFTINVAESPAPEFLSQPVVNAEEGLAYHYMAVGYDVHGDEVTLSAAQVPAWLTVTPDGDSLTLDGTPDISNVGEHHVRINATDQYGMTSQQTFTILVKANMAPVFTTFGPTHAMEGEAYEYNIMAHDDNMNDILTITASTPSWLSLNDNGDGTAELTGTPGAGDVGNSEVTVTVTDNKGASASQTFTIIVAEANSTPVFTTTPGSITVQAGTLFSYVAEVSDADGDAITFTTSIPAWVLVTNEGSGVANMRGLPMLGELGTHDMVLTAHDGQTSVSQDITVQVIDTTSAPVIETLALDNAIAGAEYSFELVSTDADGDELTYNATELPEWLTLEDNNDGTASLFGTPTSDNLGEVSIAIELSDGLHTVNKNMAMEVTNTTGIVENNAELVMYPNPAQTTVTLENVAKAQLTIYNAVGAVVYEKAAMNATENIDISSFRSGTYIVQVIKDDSAMTRSLIVK